MTIEKWIHLSVPSKFVLSSIYKKIGALKGTRLLKYTEVSYIDLNTKRQTYYTTYNLYIKKENFLNSIESLSSDLTIPKFNVRCLDLLEEEFDLDDLWPISCQFVSAEPVDLERLQKVPEFKVRVLYPNRGGVLIYYKHECLEKIDKDVRKYLQSFGSEQYCPDYNLIHKDEIKRLDNEAKENLLRNTLSNLNISP